MLRYLRKLRLFVLAILLVGMTTQQAHALSWGSVVDFVKNQCSTLMNKFDQASPTVQKLVVGGLALTALTSMYCLYKNSGKKKNDRDPRVSDLVNRLRDGEPALARANNVPAAQNIKQHHESCDEYNKWSTAIKKLPLSTQLADNGYPTLLKLADMQEIIVNFNNVMDNYYSRTHGLGWLNGILWEAFFNLNSPWFAPFVQKLVIPDGSIIAFHGDLHGDVHSLIAFMDRLQNDGYLDGYKIINPNFYMMFLGDYVDRGKYGAEVLYTMMRLKIENPDRVFMVRGNHEDIQLCNQYGFKQEFDAKFGLNDKAYKNLMHIYDLMPAALFLGIKNDRYNHVDYIQCCHGGMHKTFDVQPLLSSKQPTAFYLMDRAELNQQYLNIGFMWNDFQVRPDADTTVQVGRGCKYSKSDTLAMLGKMNVQTYNVRAVFRAHQHGDSEMMQDILNPQSQCCGVSKLWKSDKAHHEAGAVWQGMVCTFLVAPYAHKGYQQFGKYDFDAFGILRTAASFEDWRLEVVRNPLAKQ